MRGALMPRGLNPRTMSRSWTVPAWSRLKPRSTAIAAVSVRLPGAGVLSATGEEIMLRRASTFARLEFVLCWFR